MSRGNLRTDSYKTVHTQTGSGGGGAAGRAADGGQAKAGKRTGARRARGKRGEGGPNPAVNNTKGHAS